MQLPGFVRRIVPASDRSIPMWLRLLLIPVVAGLVVLGIWVTGGVLTNDFTLAMLLTGLFLTAGGAVAVIAALRWKSLVAPVLGTFVIVAGSLGGYLLVTSNRDVVVNENVAKVADPSTRPTAQPSATSTASGAPTSTATVAAAIALSRGTFTSDEHKTTGTATLVRLPTGKHVITLTTFATSPGPDLRVYLVPGDGQYVDGYLDLGHLKGNKGNQQYTIPGTADLSRFGAVIIWCRAFTVPFGHAALSDV
ncbi:MAG: hypothetical protein QOG53_1817 [Frankiales bacterium]|jgi:hypothetical protein|nr:hypothetical protein [Frankiales bacterium]